MDQYLTQLITLIKKEQNLISQSMVFGNCINFESYQRLVGQNIGLEKVLELIDQILTEEDSKEL
jgi:hypothetical protein